MLFVDLQNFTDSRAKCLDVNAMQRLFIFVFFLALASISQTSIHVAAVAIAFLTFALSIVLVGQLQRHLGADASKFGKERLNHFDVGSKLNNLVDLINFGAR